MSFISGSGKLNSVHDISVGSHDSNKTWIVEMDTNSLSSFFHNCHNFQISEGAPMNEARKGHSCAKMNVNGKMFIVVAGGSKHGSVELLDISSSSDNKGWKFGKY